MFKGNNMTTNTLFRVFSGNYNFRSKKLLRVNAFIFF